MHYAFANCVVGSWLDDHSVETLYAMICLINWRSDFPERAFAEHEARCLEGAGG